MKSISEAHSSEINKLCGVASDIFGLPGMYFANTNYRRADVVEIWDMLGVSVMNPKYKTFPPVLFLGMQEDSSLKTVFGNWELLAKVLKAALRGVTSLHQETTSGPKTNARKWNFEQVTPGSIAWAAVIVIFLLSPDTEFQKSGLGKSSSINYKDLFYHYKKLLLTNFGSAKSSASGPAGQEDHSSEVIHAMNALDMDSDSESDVPGPAPSSTAQAATLSRSDSDANHVINSEAAQPPEHFAPPISATSTLSTASTLSSASRKHAEVPVMTGPEATNTTPVVVQDSDGVIGQQPTRGRGKTRAIQKKPAAQDSEEEKWSLSSGKAAQMLRGSTVSTSPSTIDGLLQGSTRSTMSSLTSHGSMLQPQSRQMHSKLQPLGEDDVLSHYEIQTHLSLTGLVAPHVSAGPSNSLAPLPHPAPDLILFVSLPPPSAPHSTVALKLRAIKASLDFILAALRAKDHLSFITFEVGPGGCVRKMPYLCVGKPLSRGRLSKFIDEIGCSDEGQNNKFLVRASKEEKTDVVTAVNQASLDVVCRRQSHNPISGMNHTSGTYTFVKDCMMSIGLLNMKLHMKIVDGQHFRICKMDLSACLMGGLLTE
ncbi:hypothetical protein BDR03DRAFT_1011560 [Suillus americanus]|nr:hypothetical protein BDR03DRAFT_1011560 [Suillus americanus]